MPQSALRQRPCAVVASIESCQHDSLVRGQAPKTPARLAKKKSPPVGKLLSLFLQTIRYWVQMLSSYNSCGAISCPFPHSIPVPPGNIRTVLK